MGACVRVRVGGRAAAWHAALGPTGRRHSRRPAAPGLARPAAASPAAADFALRAAAPAARPPDGPRARRQEKRTRGGGPRTGPIRVTVE